LNGSGGRSGGSVIRVYALLTVLVTALVTLGSRPAFAADAVNLRVRISGPTPVAWIQAQQDVNDFQIGVEASGGTATAVTVKADLSDVAGQILLVEIQSDAECSHAGQLVTCRLASLPESEEHLIDLLVKPAAGVVGPVGRISVRASSAEDPDSPDNAANRSLDVLNGHSTDLATRVTDARGRVGDVVEIKITVTNHGPNTEPSWELTGVETQEGTEFVSSTGCHRGSYGGQDCPSPGPLLVGRSHAVTLRYRIVHDVPHPERLGAGYGLLEALNRSGGTDNIDLYFQIYIEGSTGGSGAGTGSGAATGSGSETGSDAAGAPGAAAGVDPVSSGASTTGPSTTASEGRAQKVAAIAADQSPAARLVAGGTGIVLLGLAALAAALVRRRRTAGTP
jgi:hypothetical protein